MIVPTFIGQSHTVCIVEAMISMGLPVHREYLDFPDGTPPLIDIDGTWALHPALADRIHEKIATSDAVFSTIAGNAHTVLGLMEMNPPFDFEYPGLDTPLDARARIVPYNTVRAALSKRLADWDFIYVDAVLDVVSGIKMHIQSPPPPRDNDLCLSRLDPYFREFHPDAKIATPWLRLKLWKMHSDLVRAKFAERRVGFLEVPAKSLDADGFLLEALTDPGSATHANNDYGRLVVEQIRGLRS